MDITVKDVEGGGMVSSSGVVSVPRQLAEKNQSVPSVERIEQAKARFISVGLNGVTALVEALQMLETEDVVIGYFGFTIDREGLTRKPLEEGETEGERGMKIMRLPHPQWGNRRGTATAVGDLVTLAEDSELGGLSLEQQKLLSEVFEETATFLSRGSSKGES